MLRPLNSTLIHSNATSETLARFRLVIYVVWLVNIIRTPLHLYSYLPTESFNSWGLYSLFEVVIEVSDTDFFLSSDFLYGFKFSLILLLLLCIFGIKPIKLITILTFLFLLFFDLLVKGHYGFTNHAQSALLFCTFIVTIFPSSNIFTIKFSKEEISADFRYKQALILCSVIILFAYSFIGTHRLVHDGIRVFTEGSILTHIILNSQNYSITGFQFAIGLLQNSFIQSLVISGYIVITIFEILAPLVLIYKPFRIVWLWVMIPFHLSTLFLMNIFFWENIILLTCLLTGIMYYKKKALNEGLL